MRDGRVEIGGQVDDGDRLPVSHCAPRADEHQTGTCGISEALWVSDALLLADAATNAQLLGDVRDLTG